MFRNTNFSPRQNVSTPCNSVDDSSPEDESHYYNLVFSTSVIIAVLSPVAVAGNGLILVAIWKKTFVKTPFHILLSGLVLTDLCTGLMFTAFYRTKTYGKHIYIMTMTLMLSCYLTTSFAYFKVYRIIRRHQQQVQAKETSLNFGRQAVDLAKYKKSVASMLYIVVLFSFCFIPFIVSSGVFINVPITFETVVAIRLSEVFLYLSSSLNPGLFVWRMNDIRTGVKQLFCRDN